MEWTNDKILRFLELYQMHACIWNPKNAYHKVRARINDAWDEIRNNMGEPKCTVKELKKKKESLMAMYRGYKTKIKKSQVLGAEASEIYKPIWFAFDLMDSFLSDIYICKSFFNTEDSVHQLDFEQIEDTNTSNDTVTTFHDDLSIVEEECPPTSSFSSFKQTPSATTSKRRQHDPLEFQPAKRKIDQSFSLLQNIAQPQQQDEEDECILFGKLVAKKMRKLEDDRRDLMMIKINQLFYDEHQERPSLKSEFRK